RRSPHCHRTGAVAGGGGAAGEPWLPHPLGPSGAGRDRPPQHRDPPGPRRHPAPHPVDGARHHRMTSPRVTWPRRNARRPLGHVALADQRHESREFVMGLDVGLGREEVLALIRTALDEDLRYGPDVTTVATVPEDAVV